jgi:hypothetical protein
VREKLDVLKCPGNPLFGNLVRFEIGDVLSFEEDFSGTRPINSTDAIEDGGLSGSIGSNDGIDGPFLHLKAYITQSSDAAKRDSKVFNLKNGVHNFKKNSNNTPNPPLLKRGWGY